MFRSFISGSDYTNWGFTEIGEIWEEDGCPIEWHIKNFFSYTANDSSFCSRLFHVSGLPWHLRIIPNGDPRYNVGWIGLYLFRDHDSATPQGVTFTFGVKRADGTVENLVNFTHVLQEKGHGVGCPNFLQRTVLIRRSVELAPSDTLTLTCCLSVIEITDPYASINVSRKLEIGAISVKSDRFVEWTIKDIFSYDIAENFCYHSPHFVVSDSLWCLRIYPNGQTEKNNLGWIGLYLFKRLSKPSQRAHFSFGVKTADGIVQEFTKDLTWVFGDKGSGYGAEKFLLRSELLSRRAVLVPEDTLTLTLSIETSFKTEIGVISVAGDGLIEWTILDIFSYEKEDDLYHSPSFDVSSSPWYFSICPNGTNRYNNVGWIHLFLYREDYSAPPQRANFSLGVKNVDGTVEQIRTGCSVFDEKGSAYGDDKLLLRSELLSRKTELAPKDSLTLTLSIKTSSKLEIGEISVKDDRRIEWNIKDIFSYEEEEDDFYDSPRFDVSGIRWYLSIYPNGEKKYNSIGWIQFHFHREDDSAPSQRAKCIFGVRRIDGTVAEMRTVTVVFGEKGRTYGDNKLLQRSELLCRKTELAPEDALTLTLRFTLSDIIEIGAISVEGDGHIEWRIKDIFSYKEEGDLFFSPRFDVSYTRWYLGIYPNGDKEDDSVGWITLQLFREDASAPPQRTKCSFGVKKACGNVEYLVKDDPFVFDEKEQGYGFRLLQRSLLRRRKAKLAPADALVLTCSLKVYDNIDASASDCDCCNLS